METIIEGVDYGPIACLVGRWKGQKGMDVSPEPGDGIERTPFHEVMTFDAIGDVTNAQKETLAVVRYHQVVSKQVNDEVFHDQVGYWLYDKSEQRVIHTLSIPRAVSVIAGGQATVENEKTILKVSAELGHADWGIIQSPFMRDNASTQSFSMEMIVHGDHMHYRESTILSIYGNQAFDHRDKSELQRL